MHFTGGDQNWQGGLVLAAKIGPAGPILAAKVVRGDQFWQKFLPKLVRLDRFWQKFFAFA